MNNRIKNLRVLIIIMMSCFAVFAQKESFSEKKTQINNSKSNSNSTVQHSPYVMNVKIQKSRNNKRVVTSVKIEEKIDKREKQKSKKFTQCVTSKEEGLKLRKNKKK